MGRLPSRWLWMAMLGLAAACGGPADRRAADLPPIPALEPEVFPEAVREQLRSAVTAVEAAPADVQANADLAMVAHAYRQYGAAEALYERAAKLDPASFRWLYYLGVVRAQQGHSEAALEALAAAKAIDADYPPLQLRLAETYTELNRLDEATAIYETMLESDSGDAAARYGLGRIQALRGDSSAAIENLLEAIRLVPDYGAAHYEISLAYRDIGETAKARMHLERHDAGANGAPRPNDPLMNAVDARKPGVGDYVSRARQFESRGELNKAVAEHLEALQHHPEVAQLHVNLVSLYGRTGDFDRASEHYRKALEINPNQADLHYNYGVLLFEAERYAEASAAFERAVEANPEYAEAHNNLGQLAERRGRFDEAIQHYRKAIQARPNLRLARFHLGRMLLGERRPAEAAQQFEAASTPRDDMTPRILFGLATAKVQLGDRAGALAVGRQAKDLAEQMGQQELARGIERDLAKLQ